MPLPILARISCLMERAEHAADAGDLVTTVGCLAAMQAASAWIGKEINQIADYQTALEAERGGAELLQRLRALLARVSADDAAHALATRHAS